MIITPIYAGLLGLLLVVLSARVILMRRQQKISLGHAENTALERRIRAHGNFAEYAPMALILIGLLELSGFGAAGLHLLGIALVCGRLLHGWAFSFTDGNMVGRVGGMIITLTVIGLAALLNLLQVLSGATGG